MIGQVEPLGAMARSIAYSQNGTIVAVGFGGRVGRGKEAGGGAVRVYTTPNAKGGVKKLCEVLQT